jgi:hypothetical protein
MYKHLLIISDGEIHENSLYLTDRGRAESLLEWVKNPDQTISDEARRDVENAMHEAELDAAEADSTQGSFPNPRNAEKYVGIIRETLMNCDIDVYFDDVALPSALRELNEVSAT